MHWAVLSLAAATLLPFTVQGDGVPAPLGGLQGDAARGRALVANRQQGLCLLCHAAPLPEQRQQGQLGPDLTGVGARLSPAQLRLRLVQPQAVVPESLMPAYYRAGPDSGLRRVAPAYRDQPLFSAQQLEDVVAYLSSLK